MINLQFELIGQPAGVHASFDPAQVQTGAATTLTLTAEGGVPQGSSSCAVAITAAAGRAEIPFSLEVVAPGDGAGGGCASAAPQPLIGLGLALLAARRKRRAYQFRLPGCVSGNAAISASNCRPSSVTIR